MVKAKLPEPQTWDLKPGGGTLMVYVPYDAGDTEGRTAVPDCGRERILPARYSNCVTHPPQGGYGRTGHLTASHLLPSVTTGSPKRAALNGPAWRRSRHSTLRPGVTPGTAGHGRTGMGETDRATGRGSPSPRGKDGASTEDSNFMTTIISIMVLIGKVR
jgi:hypothetical protein